MLVVHGSSYVKKFAERTGGFVVLRYRLKRWWNIPTIWPICFAILFGHDVVKIDFERPFDLFSLLEIFLVDGRVKILYPEVLPVITAMLQNGLKTVVKDQQDPDSPLQERSNGDATLQTMSVSESKHIRSRSMSLHTELVSISKSPPFRMMSQINL